ncbi:MAG TPA: sulfatase-like hydrolase/transferase [Pirellulaceae bacterium]|nr:sulfatase-like hydrolase/transferase [Pirellulaceae bacterium]
MKTSRFLMGMMFSLLIAAPCLPARAAAPERPNILFIFGDDCGIDSFGCYGSDHARGMTPNIDALAKSGTRYERGYATPLCGPSRCCIMTGRHGFRTGGLTNQTAGNPSYKDEPSLAKILKSAGYATGMAGKWRQMSDSPGDWGFDEYITDPTASGWYWKDNYTKNGQEVKLDKEVYVPDHCSDLAVDFIRRHKDQPFYFYLSSHLIHGPILTTPDSKEGATPAQLYDDNIKYLDKTVGKLVAELDKLGLREKTLILFTTDNGTAPPAYQEQHDPKKDVGQIDGRHVNGRKGQLLEGGSRVPLIASWRGTIPPGQVSNELHDFTDLLPTFAELAGTKLPAGVKFDGRSFAPQLKGEKGNPREWIFVQLGAGWYVRDDGWKMNEKGELFSMKDSPFVEAPVAADSTDPAAQAARKRLSAVLADLNPAGGKTVPAGADDKTKAEKKAKKQAQKAANAKKQ